LSIKSCREKFDHFLDDGKKLSATTYTMSNSITAKPKLSDRKGEKFVQ
jgi:hypothetical protein